MTFNNPVVRHILIKYLQNALIHLCSLHLALHFPQHHNTLFFAGVARYKIFPEPTLVGPSVDVPRVSHTPHFDTGSFGSVRHQPGNNQPFLSHFSFLQQRLQSLLVAPSVI
jgi:hypothetical protein